MPLDQHISNVCRSAYVEIRRISSIRQYPSAEATKTLVCAFVFSKLDYCNSLLPGCPLYNLRRLQRVQNSAAKLVLKSRKRDHVKPRLQAFHWLPVQARIDYKLSSFCHNFFSDLSPAYLSDFLTGFLTPSRQLRSSADTRTLLIPHVQTKTFGQCSFSSSASKQWNSLSSDIRYIQSSRAFKTVLKTHLYKQYYSN